MKAKRVNEVVYVAVSSYGYVWKRTCSPLGEWCDNQAKGMGINQYRIARCRLVEVPRKKRKVKP